MKRTGALLTALTLAITLSACGGSKDGQSTNEPAAAEVAEETEGPTAAELAPQLAGMPLDEALKLAKTSSEKIGYLAQDRSPITGDLAEWTVIGIDPDANTPTMVVEKSISQPTEATDKQLASIVAEYAPDWRETIEEAGQCRMLWVSGTEDPIQQMSAYTCYLREQTMPLSAQNVATSLRTLTPPPSMSDLYDETLQILDRAASVDIMALCGNGETPSTDDACTTSLGAMMGHYRAIDGLLNKWSPYL